MVGQSMNKYEIMKWLYIRAEKLFRAAHLEKYGNDIKCDGCNEWFSVSGIKYNHTNKYDEHKDVFICQCGQCGNISRWSPSIAPFLVRVDDLGNPISHK